MIIVRCSAVGVFRGESGLLGLLGQTPLCRILEDGAHARVLVEHPLEFCLVEAAADAEVEDRLQT